MRTKKTKKEDFKTEVEQFIEPTPESEPTPELESVPDYEPTEEEIKEFSEYSESVTPEPEQEPEQTPEPTPEPEPIQEPEPTEPTEPSANGETPKKQRKPYTKRNKSDLIDDIKKDYKPKDDGKGQVISVGVNKKKVDLSKYVSGTLLIMLIDSLIPNLMLYAGKYIAPEKYKNAKVESLQMTFEERKQIEPLANEVIVVLIGELSPLEAFLIFTAVIYGSKMLTL
jgi:hypothetical protein